MNRIDTDTRQRALQLAAEAKHLGLTLTAVANATGYSERWCRLVLEARYTSLPLVERLERFLEQKWAEAPSARPAPQLALFQPCPQ